jgi:hypothetical protein
MKMVLMLLFNLALLLVLILPMLLV